MNRKTASRQATHSFSYPVASRLISKRSMEPSFEVQFVKIQFGLDHSTATFTTVVLSQNREHSPCSPSLAIRSLSVKSRSESQFLEFLYPRTGQSYCGFSRGQWISDWRPNLREFDYPASTWHLFKTKMTRWISTATVNALRDNKLEQDKYPLSCWPSTLPVLKPTPVHPIS